MSGAGGASSGGASETSLRHLHALVRTLNGDLDLSRTLQAVCQGIVDGLGFEVAVVNLVMPDGPLEVVAVAGSESAHGALFGTRASRSEWDALMAACTPRGGVLLGYDHDAHPTDVRAWVPDTPVRPEPDAWHPLDELFAPLRTAATGLLGVISVDLPVDGRRPTDDQLELLEMYAGQASVAIENAQLHTAQGELLGRLSGLLTEVPVAILELDLDGLVVDWNPEAERIFGWSRGEVLGRRNPTVDHEGYEQRLAEMVDTGGVHRQQVRRMRKDGSLVDVEMSNRVVRDADGRPFGFIGALVDVSERVALERELWRGAHTDGLTGLPNRTLLYERVEAARDDPGASWLLLLDLDGFKGVNDGHGHALGDLLLQLVAERLRLACRPIDVPARLGGDEFVVLVAGDHAAATSLAERLVRLLAEPFTASDRSLTVGCSIGLAPVSGTGPGEALRDADIAMYAAKAAGKGRVRTFTADLGAAALDRADLVEDLRVALAEDQLLVRYHPVVNVRSRGVVGVEALVRWAHPTRGELAPQDFLALAEETGLVVLLGERVLHEACAQVRRWQRELPHCEKLTLSVNLSAVQLRDRSVVEHVRSALGASGLPPYRLLLEITETVLMEDLDAGIEVLHALKALGVRLAMDDFGSGYSSLRYLRRLPVDVVKLDRELLEGVEDEPEARALVGAVLDLVATIGRQAIAEGVETVDQLVVLEQLDCPLVQGYLFGRPLLPAEAERLLSVRWPSSGVPLRPGETLPRQREEWSSADLAGQA